MKCKDCFELIKKVFDYFEVSNDYTISKNKIVKDNGTPLGLTEEIIELLEYLRVIKKSRKYKNPRYILEV